MGLLWLWLQLYACADLKAAVAVLAVLAVLAGVCVCGGGGGLRLVGTFVCGV